MPACLHKQVFIISARAVVYCEKPLDLHKQVFISSIDHLRLTSLLAYISRYSIYLLESSTTVQKHRTYTSRYSIYLLEHNAAGLNWNDLHKQVFNISFRAVDELLDRYCLHKQIFVIASRGCMAREGYVCLHKQAFNTSYRS